MPLLACFPAVFDDLLRLQLLRSRLEPRRLRGSAGARTEAALCPVHRADQDQVYIDATASRRAGGVSTGRAQKQNIGLQASADAGVQEMRPS